jgi:hypothetical protein
VIRVRACAGQGDTNRQGAEDAVKTRSGCLAFFGALAVQLLFIFPARADDWLAALPECAGELPPPAAAQLIYPRPGLPAVVAAGETLIVRARVPLPLTPPPGVQQPRALEGFEAELIGHALPLGAPAPVQRMALELIDVRPEGPSSLRYRLSFPIPAWTAPGTYDLVLRAKGAGMRADSLVRVVGQDASSRDILAAAAPVLQTDGLVAALRIGGDRLWVIGSCEAPYLPFEAEVASVLRAERRQRVADPERAGLKPAPTPEASAVGAGYQPALLTPIKEGWELNAPGPLELSLLFPATAGSPGLRAERGTLRFHPAADLTTVPPALIARWSLPAAGRARLLRVAAPPLHAQLQALPDPVLGDQPVRVSGRADRALAALALRFDHLHTAYGLQPVAHRYRALGKHRVSALAIAVDGTAVALQTEVTVRTVRASGGPGCMLAGPVGGTGTAPALRGGASSTRPVSAGPGLWLSALLLKRRGRRAAGNRLGAEPRSARSSSSEGRP